jgi:hypothetical protein
MHPGELPQLIPAYGKFRTSEGALADYDATVANYCQTTWVAFQEVEDNLAALRILEHEAAQAAQQKEAAAEAQRGVEIFQIDTSSVPTPTFRLSPLRRLRYKTSGTKSRYVHNRRNARKNTSWTKACLAGGRVHFSDAAARRFCQCAATPVGL